MTIRTSPIAPSDHVPSNAVGRVRWRVAASSRPLIVLSLPCQTSAVGPASDTHLSFSGRAYVGGEPGEKRGVGTYPGNKRGGEHDPFLLGVTCHRRVDRGEDPT